MVAKTSTFRQQKFFLFYLKFSAEVNELTLKATASSQKMLKTKIVQKKYIYAFFGPEGLSDTSRLREEHKIGFFRRILILFLFLKQKYLQENQF